MEKVNFLMIQLSAALEVSRFRVRFFFLTRSIVLFRSRFRKKINRFQIRFQLYVSKRFRSQKKFPASPSTFVKITLINVQYLSHSISYIHCPK